MRAPPGHLANAPIGVNSFVIWGRPPDPREFHPPPRPPGHNTQPAAIPMMDAERKGHHTAYQCSPMFLPLPPPLPSRPA